jgi:glycosyltransferase involved in cell wall biosynthesis
MIISDNGSTDATRDYLDSLSDSRIKIFKQEKNLGIFGNLNFLLENVETDIAKILCADDTLLPGSLEAIFTFMKDRPLCVVSRCWSVGDAERFSSTGKSRLEGMLPEHISPVASTLAFATFGNLVGNLSKAACRPRLVLEAGGFDQRFPYAGDYEGWVRVAKRYGIYLQNVELVLQRVHAAQNTNLLNVNNELISQQKKILEYLALNLDKDDLKLLKRHWTIHHLAPRLTKSFKLALRGNYRQAAEAWHSLPLGISAISCLVVYPLWKLKLPIINKVTKLLLDRIQKVNTGEL